MSVGPLDHRAGRAIAVGRTLLALLFLAAALTDSEPPGAKPGLVRILLLVYLPICILLAAVGWNRWWLEYRLALPAHYLDLTAFALLVLASGGYSSPYLGFSVFLILAAAMRWHARQALVTSCLVGLIYLASFWFPPGAPGPDGLSRFVAEGAALLVVAAIILWLSLAGFRSAQAAQDGQLLDAIVSAEPPARECLRHAADRLGARRALLLWSETEEPWLNILSWDGRAIASEKLGPEAIADPLDDMSTDEPFLFDCAGRRTLVGDGGQELMSRSVDPFPPDFAQRYRLAEGLAIPIRTSRHSAMLIALDVPGLCSALLATGQRLRGDIAGAFERAALLGSMRDASRAASRLSLARNLHDGALQFLAGIALKLRAAKASLDDPEAVRRGLEDLEAELARQQSDVRAIIHNLRQPPGRLIRIDFDRHLETLAQRLRDRWGVAVDLAASAEGEGSRQLLITTSFCYDIEQMVGEAASNAVRHGAARHLRLGLTLAGDGLCLEIADDGTGFPFAGLRSDAELWQRRLGPLTLHQRVRSLGGTLAIDSSRTGSTLSLRLPVEEQPR